MIILGLLFILFVALVGTWFYLALADLAGGGPANDLSAMGITIGLSPAALLLTGFASALALAMGLYLIKAGLSSSARRRRERKDLERTAAESQRAADAAAAERLRTAGYLDCLQLLHFHIGSQVSAIRTFKDALREAARTYVELHKLGFDIRYMDVGGGRASRLARTAAAPTGSASARRVSVPARRTPESG